VARYRALLDDPADRAGQLQRRWGTLEGFPLVGIGFNQHLAWTHTVSTSRRFVAYQLNLVPGDPTSYSLDGKPVKMGQVTVSLKYGKSHVTHTFYTSHWGVMADVPAASYAWTTTNAYALYDATASDGPRAANQYLRMGQASTVQGLYGVEAKYLAIPTSNRIAADDHGNAYYGDVGDTPNVSQSEIKSCLPAGLPTAVFSAARVVTLDGSRSACAPANSPGTPVKGIFKASQLPHAFRRDYVEQQLHQGHLLGQSVQSARTPDLAVGAQHRQPRRPGALRRGVRRILAGDDDRAQPERANVAGDPDLLAGHGSDVAVVREHDAAVLEPELGHAGLHPGSAERRASAGRCGPGRWSCYPRRSRGRSAGWAPPRRTRWRWRASVAWTPKRSPRRMR
jgi:hypothetical protein